MRTSIYVCCWFHYGWKWLPQWIVLMEAIGDYYVPSDKILDAWHCTLGVILHTLWVKCVQAVFMQCSPYTLSWNTETCRESLRVLVVGLRCTISRMFSCSSTFCWRARPDETWALGSVTHSCNVDLGKHSAIRNSAHKKTVDGILEQQQWHYHRKSRKRTAYLHIRHLWKCAAFFTHFYSQQSQQPTDNSYRFTCFRQLPNTAGRKVSSLNT
jgi:hypothetical protein